MTPSESSVCLNCGQAAGPGFCGYCGQEIGSRQRPLREVGREILSDWLSLDSQLLRSLRALLRPGRLSELYISGKRAPFVRPFRLYLIASVVLFSTLLTLETPDASRLNVYVGGELIGTEAVSDDNVNRDMQFVNPKNTIDRWLLGLAGDRIDRLKALPKQEVVELMFSSWRRVLPLSLIVFVPFLALGLKLLYVRKRVEHTLYLDHLVFSLHFQAALFFALSGVWLIARLPGISLVVAGVAYGFTGVAMLLIYLPLALRRFYRQSRFWTALKTLALLFVYFRLLGLVMTLAFFVAIWKV